MQKAIYYASRIIAARGVLELTDRHLNFQVSQFDASFGFKDISIDLCTIDDIRIEGGEFRPKVVVVCAAKNYEFVLAKGQELYDRLRELQRDPLKFGLGDYTSDKVSFCQCGKKINRIYRFCPWCGCRLVSS